ncbi:MAG: phosphotransferase family protein [Micromonosporaceae bacterium]|nr:phosphotransferase family protein [Micromonosporaceae bacterium]
MRATGGDIEAVLERLPLLWPDGRDGQPPRWAPLPGGLSHHVYRVDTVEASYVLRVLDPALSELGLSIDPALELANTALAAESGAGAAVLAVLEDVPALLLEFIPGRTLSQPDIAGHIPGIAAACRRLHAGPRFVGDFDILATLAQWLQMCDRHGLPLPDAFGDRLPEVRAIGAALGKAPLPSVPCHNDLLPENLILSGDLVRIVDYQVAGNNDPTFELGDIAAEADLDDDETAALAHAYFGAEATPALLARTRLQLILSNVTWPLWFTVHHGLLQPAGGAAGFDYRGEAEDKWRQACRDLDSGQLGRLLQEAARG